MAVAAANAFHVPDSMLFAAALIERSAALSMRSTRLGPRPGDRPLVYGAGTGQVSLIGTNPTRLEHVRSFDFDPVSTSIEAVPTAPVKRYD